MGALGEDVQDELRPVHHPDLHHLADVAHLRRREVRIHDHEVRGLLLDDAAQLLQLPFAHVGGRVRLRPLLRHLRDDLRPGGRHQFAQFRHVGLDIRSLLVDRRDDRLLRPLDNVQSVNL